MRRGGTGLQIKIVFFVVIFAGIQGIALLAASLYGLPLAGMVWTAIGITALSSFVSAVWGASLTRSVLELMRACRVAIKGDLQSHTILPRGDEIGELCDEINSLVDALRNYRDEVIKLRGQPGFDYPAAPAIPQPEAAAPQARPVAEYSDRAQPPIENRNDSKHPGVGPSDDRRTKENKSRERVEKLARLSTHLREITESVAVLAEAFAEAKEAAWGQLQLCEKAAVRLEVFEHAEGESALKGIAEEARDETARLRELLKTATEKLKSVPELSEIQTLFREVDVLALNATIELTKGTNREKAVGIIDELREKLARLSRISNSILIEPPEELDSAAESGETLSLELGRILEITDAAETAESDSQKAESELRRILSSIAEIAGILQDSVRKSQDSMDNLRSAQETLGIALRRIELEDDPLA